MTLSAKRYFQKTSRQASLVVGLVGLVGALALSGCAPEPSSATTTEPPEEVQQATNVPTDVPNVPEMRAQVTLSKCLPDGTTGWKASGQVSNSGKDAKDYTITVFFTSDQGTVIGVGDTKLNVEAGKSSDWEIATALTPAKKTRCVLRGVG